MRGTTALSHCSVHIHGQVDIRAGRPARTSYSSGSSACSVWTTCFSPNCSVEPSVSGRLPGCSNPQTEHRSGFSLQQSAAEMAAASLLGCQTVLSQWSQQGLGTSRKCNSRHRRRRRKRQVAVSCDSTDMRSSSSDTEEDPPVNPPNSRDSPPVRDTGIGSEQEWGISLQSQPTNESGLNADGSTWYRESGEDIGENGYRCRWIMMGGRNYDWTVEWKETWWEKSDWTGYKELGAEKSGRNAQGDSWWETWQEIFRIDEYTGLGRIEKSAHKQAKSRSDGIWNEKWWEKYNTKGWTDKGAHKYGRLHEQSWWEKWGEQYDGRGAVLKWTDKWAESDTGTKWGDKWEDRFNSGIGTRQGETWHVSSTGERWSRTWGEEHFGTGKVHKYGKSTSGELWDAVVAEDTYYEASPHYGWEQANSNSLQLLAIEIRERPPPPSEEDLEALPSSDPPSLLE